MLVTLFNEPRKKGKKALHCNGRWWNSSAYREEAGIDFLFCFRLVPITALTSSFCGGCAAQGKVEVVDTTAMLPVSPSTPVDALFWLGCSNHSQ